MAWVVPLFVGEDQSEKLAQLIAELRGTRYQNGRGKVINSGFLYWGAGPTMAWARTCADPLYPMMRESFRSFSASWRNIRAQLPDGEIDYVSLGPGNGTKDRMVLSRLMNESGRHPFYVAVDMSAEMLHLAAQAVMQGTNLQGDMLVGVQLDFSILENVRDLEKLLGDFSRDRAILFSLLGNTVANFEDDAEVLFKVSKLMRPQDRLLLEVATTDVLTAEAAHRAAEEYAQSRTFREFLVSTLFHQTDLTVSLDDIDFTGHVESDRAIKVDIDYVNHGSEAVKIKLADGSDMSFPTGDAIRLDVTRKYTDDGIRALLAKCGLRAIASERTRAPRVSRSQSGFGIRLMLLESEVAGSEKRISELDLADEIWNHYYDR